MQFSFDPQLPVAARHQEIADLIRDHQVVVLAGETGSGKTTQIPKICLSVGRGEQGRIACTQPRRIAARSLAQRLAEECHTEIGQGIGFKVRFSDHVSQDTKVKVMTDGILLSETQNDRLLKQYDTIIIDEAHERSLNIDFLLGYLKQILPKRPDLKLIITSATIDTERFSKHFKNAPILEVSGRTYPVDVLYRPLDELEEDTDNPLLQGILNAVDELTQIQSQGDVLVFLPGEREIRETAEGLRKHHPKNTEILPLFARQSAKDQQKIFNPGPQRRIILSTNVAETSLTVPRIHAVIDTGIARISRYSVRSKVQRLPIEPVSQASANQRKGRCGRIAEGICVRLYSEEDFNSRPEFTEPEILRTNLASVILQMKALKLGDIRQFPFVEPPENKLINDGVKSLQEIGALNHKRQLTHVGRQIARFPVDPKIARMLLAANEEGVLHEVLVIAAALSIVDPRDWPMDQQEKAKEKHGQFFDTRSDFLAYVYLWLFYEDQRKHLSTNKLAKLCKQNMLSFMRMREWREIYSQLLRLVKDLKWNVDEIVGLEENEFGEGLRLNQTRCDSIHRSLLHGLLGNIGQKDERFEYLGARGIKLRIHPTSALYKVNPKWLMASELVETSRLYARCVAAIDPKWIERIAKHLVKKSYYEPHWERRPNHVAAYQQITLYGLIIVAKRTVNYGPINPEESRKIFIRHALVQGEIKRFPPFLKHNQKIIREILRLESKARRPDILVDEERQYEFYNERLAQGIYNFDTFEQWRKTAEKVEPKLLYMSVEALMQREAKDISDYAYPDKVQLNDLPIQLDYNFKPGDTKDGLIVNVPLPMLNQFKAETFSWLVPGLLKEKAELLIRSLPKSVRKQFVPIPETVETLLKELTPSDQSFELALAQWLNKHSKIEISEDDWLAVDRPEYLKPKYKVLGEGGKTLAIDGDLSVLKRKFKDQLDTVAQSSNELSNQIWTEFPNQTIEQQTTVKNYGVEMVVYPALSVEKEGVKIAQFSTQTEADNAHSDAVRWLLKSRLSSQLKSLTKSLPLAHKTCLVYQKIGKCEQLKADIVEATLNQLYFAQTLPRTQADFDAWVESGRADLHSTAEQFCKVVDESLALYQEIASQLTGSINLRLMKALADVKSQLDHLIYRGFVEQTPVENLQSYPRYLKALVQRMERVDNNPMKDEQLLAPIRSLWERCQKQLESSPHLEQTQTFRWMMEELRVATFSSFKPSIPISIKKIEKYLRE